MIEQKISKEYKFEASHILPNHDGKCARLHGHSYRVVVEVTGDVSERKNSSREGMIIDYAILDQLVSPIIVEMDHRHLMDHYDTDIVSGWCIEAGFEDWFYEVGARTTAENLARHIFQRVFTKEALSRMPQLRYAKVTVKETVKTSASYGRGV
jgi:6-pyruvoyltetrahydropterin/6-carboxytetrahydropterin synthase